MYHYVRPESAVPPHFRYLPLDGFRRQLDHFAAQAHIASASEFFEALRRRQPLPNSVVLTFDDGLADHYEYVFPELCARGLWGLFFVPTLPYAAGRVLDVHKTHLALGRAGGRRVLRELEPLLRPEMLEPEYVARLEGCLYRGHIEDEATAEVKRLLNYYLRLEHREQVCDQVYRQTGGIEDVDVKRHYASADQLRAMGAAGMTLGAHSVSHRLLSQLAPDEQTREVEESLSTLGELLGERVRSFCFPYGGDHSFDAHTLGTLEASGIDFAFSVEPREISARDLSEQRLALPRYDCNGFPHGQSKVGPGIAV